VISARVAIVLGGLLVVVPQAAHAQEKQEEKKPEEKEEKKEDDVDVGTDVDDAHKREQEKSEHGAHSPARQEIEAQSAPPKRSDEANDPEQKRFTLGAYVETFYQWNFNHPSNGITNQRGFDNRHNTITIANAVLDAGFRAKDLLARLALQAGHTPAMQFRDETRLPGSDSANEVDDKLWRHFQRASVGWQPNETLLVEGGIFLSAYGVESLAVKDNWNWSRSNAFTRLPNYQTGFKTTLHLSKRVDVIGGVFNGWNNVVDNNDEKSFFAQAQYKAKEEFTASLAYYGGVERRGGAKEGRAWRHVAQSYAQWDPLSWFEVSGEADGGFEDNRFGFHWFAAAIAWARVKAFEWLYFAGRGERVWEDRSANASGESDPILFDAKHVTSGTLTADVRPVKGLSTRLELRHDRASTDLYFRRQVQGDGTETSPYVPNTSRQTTLLFGVTAWF
jgi:hypothetical protein